MKVSSLYILLGLVGVTILGESTASFIRNELQGLETKFTNLEHALRNNLPSRHGFVKQTPLKGSKTHLLDKFSVQNCSSDQVVLIKKITLDPDPLIIPGPATVSFDVDVKTTVIKGIQAELDLYKEVAGFYVHVPCIDNVGSCKYGDICDRLAQIQCPPELKQHGLNCKCPIQQKEYNIPASTFNITGTVPSILDGGFKVKIQLSDNGKPLACYQVYFNIHGK